MLLSSVAAMSACIDAHCTFVGRATNGRAAVGAEPAAGKIVAHTATAALLAAAGNATVAAAGYANVTGFAATGRPAVTAAASVAALAASRAGLAAGRAVVTAAGVAIAACLADDLADVVAGAVRAAVAFARAAIAVCLDATDAAGTAAAVAAAAAAAVLLPNQASLLQFSPLTIGGVPTALHAHVQRITGGEIDAFIASLCLKTSLAQEPVEMLSWYCARRRSAAQPKAGSCRAVAAPMFCVSLLNHQAGGDLHIQLPQLGLFRLFSSAFTVQPTLIHMYANCICLN